MSNAWRFETIESCLQSFGLPRTKLPTSQYMRSGKYPIIDQGQAEIAGWTDDRDGVIDEQLPVVVFGDHTRTLKYVDVPFVRGADGTQILKPRPDIDPRFFFYALRSLNLAGRGYNRHFRLLKEQLIPIPELSEQVEIASLLKVVEDRVRLEQQQLDVVQDLRTRAMMALYSKGLKGESTRLSELGEIPSSWEVKEFSQLRESLRYGTSQRCTTTPTRYPVLRIPNILSARIDASDLKYCDVPAKEVARYQLQIGDLMFIRTNGVIDRLGLCAVYRGTPGNALFASYLIRARLLDGVDPDYVAYFMGSPIGVDQVGARATPAADGKFNLNTGIIDSLLVPLPRLEEQRAIVAVLRSIDQKLHIHRSKAALLDELYQRVLGDLMTGTVGVHDLVVQPRPSPEGSAA